MVPLAMRTAHCVLGAYLTQFAVRIQQSYLISVTDPVARASETREVW